MEASDFAAMATLLASAVTAVATVFLWKVTGVLAAETKRMAERSSQPQVVATIGPNRWSMMHADLTLENTGNATAFDIQVSFNPPLRNGEARGKEMPLPLHAVSLLKPGQLLSSYVSEFEPIIDQLYTVTISWRRDPSKSDRQQHEYLLNLAEVKGMTQLGASDPLVQIAEQVKKLQEDNHRVISGSRKPRIDVFTSEDRRAEREDMELRFAAQKTTPDQGS